MKYLKRINESNDKLYQLLTRNNDIDNIYKDWSGFFIPEQVKKYSLNRNADIIKLYLEKIYKDKEVLFIDNTYKDSSFLRFEIYDYFVTSSYDNIKYNPLQFTLYQYKDDYFILRIFKTESNNYLYYVDGIDGVKELLSKIKISIVDPIIKNNEEIQKFRELMEDQDTLSGDLYNNIDEIL